MHLEISDKYIEETGTYDRKPQYYSQEAIELVATSPSYTDPMIIVDGIDHIRVVQESKSEYLIHYQGYVNGYTLVTNEGIREFAENYLSNESGIPDWYIVGGDTEQEPLAWWVPDSYDPIRTVDCDRCTTTVSVPDVVTPGRADGDVVDWFCHDCWDDVRDRWSPEWAHAGRTDVHRAAYLDQTVGGHPDEADIDELVELVQSNDEKAQMHALTALGRLIPARLGDIVSIRPILTDQLDSDVLLTRYGALSCLTMIAEHDPESALPVVDEVLPYLDPSFDGGILEEGIRFVAAIAEEHPVAVQDAVPNLIVLLQEDLTEQQNTVQALVNIAKGEPEAVASEIPDLLNYIRDGNADHRAGIIAAVGYVAKTTPDAAEATVPTMIDLLDTSPDRVRANAVGVLADLSEVYPEQLLSNLDQIIDLVGDNDEYAQQNATYVLSQIAKQYPDEVEPGTGKLIDALNADNEQTRLNACQTLGYAGATAAIEPLEECRDHDPNMDVQQAAGWALGQIPE